MATQDKSTSQTSESAPAAPEKPPSPPKEWMEGGCHCGAVAFRVLHAPFEYPSTQVVSCNCTICTANGYLLTYPPRKEIEWIKGWEEMGSYRFGTKTRDHRFCGKCGSSVCIDFGGCLSWGDDVVGMNVRMFKDVDIKKLNLEYSFWREK